MITLMSPPVTATKILHFNCPSKSPGGKDYVLVRMANGELWACNGPSSLVRNCRGSIQNPKKTWSEMVNEKQNKGYVVVGEYAIRSGGFGAWWSQTGESYAEVLNIPIQPPQTAQQARMAITPPKPKPPVQPKPPEATSLAAQYPLNRKVKELWGETPGGGNDWFLATP